MTTAPGDEELATRSFNFLEIYKVDLFSSEPIIATKEHANAPWSGNKKNFRCGLCGHKFKIGDIFHGLYTNDIKGTFGNPLVCKTCFEGKEETRQKWKNICESWKEIKNKYWFFMKNL